MKKIVTLLGSPRTKGNTATLANAFNQAAEASGAHVQTFILNNMKLIEKFLIGRCELLEADAIETKKRGELIALAGKTADKLVR